MGEPTKGRLYWPTDPAWPCPTCGATAFQPALPPDVRHLAGGRRADQEHQVSEPTECPTCEDGGNIVHLRAWRCTECDWWKQVRIMKGPALPPDVREALGVAVREMDLMLGMDVCDNADRDEIAAALNVLRAYLKRTEAGADEG